MVLAVVILIGVLGVTVGLYVVYRGQPAIPPTSSGQQVVIRGVIVCLPHQGDDSGPQTLECAYGLKGEDGYYYALHTPGSQQMVLSTSFNKSVEVRGTFFTEKSDAYQSVGVIEVAQITGQ